MFLLGILGVLGTAFLVMILWNALIPSLFNGPVISFVQALGLLVLSKILFSGGSCRRREKHWFKNRMKDRWREKIRQKMKDMSPEEREAFKKGFKGKWNKFDVEVFDVEEEEENKDDDQGDDAPPKSDKGK